MTVDIFNTENRYDLILADPPWKQSKGGKKSAHDKNAVEVPYAPADANRGMSGVWGQRSK